MRTLEAIANTTTRSILEEHTLDLPVACRPRSKNPRPGGTITITYRPSGKSLEIGSLYAYLHEYQGGLKDEQGNLLVRDMEGMIQQIALDCARAVGVPVTVVAQLVLAPAQGMKIAILQVPA